MNTGKISLFLTERQIDEHDESRVEIYANGNAALKEFYIGARVNNRTPLVGLTLNREEAKALQDSLQIFIDAAG